MALTDYSTNPANNGVVLGVQYWPEGMLPAQVNDTGRQMMADLATWLLAPTFPSGTLSLPSSGTVALQIKGNATTNLGYIQFVDSTGANQWGFAKVDATGLLTWSGGFNSTGNLTENGSRVWAASTLTAAAINSIYGYTPYSSANPAGYITSITGSMVTTALGYTPVNRAGDTITGTLTVNGVMTGVTGIDGTTVVSQGFGLRVRASASGPAIIQATNNGATAEYGTIHFVNGKMTVNFGGTDVFSIDSSGNVKALGNISGAQSSV